MDVSYDDVADFMEKYFEAFSTLAQRPETSAQMHDFYAEDMRVTQYFPAKAESDRDQFLRMSSAHPGIQETLYPEHMIIDLAKKRVGVFLRGEFTIHETGETITQMFTAHYALSLDEQNKIKIKELLIFAEYVPEGKGNIVDLYEEAFSSLN